MNSMLQKAVTFPTSWKSQYERWHVHWLRLALRDNYMVPQHIQLKPASTTECKHTGLLLMTCQTSVGCTHRDHCATAGRPRCCSTSWGTPGPGSWPGSEGGWASRMLHGPHWVFMIAILKILDKIIDNIPTSLLLKSAITISKHLECCCHLCHTPSNYECVPSG